MKNIHLIEKTAGYNRVQGTEDEWTTGTWLIKPSKAESLIGGQVFLHTRQNAPSYLGGEILAIKDVGGGRVTIHFRFNKDSVNRTTENCNGNWSVEMLIDKEV